MGLMNDASPRHGCNCITLFHLCCSDGSALGFFSDLRGNTEATLPRALSRGQLLELHERAAALQDRRREFVRVLGRFRERTVECCCCPELLMRLRVWCRRFEAGGEVMIGWARTGAFLIF